MINMERAGDTGLTAFKRAVQSKGRDLLQCLEEERRTSNKLKPARMTPLYAAAQTNAAAAAQAGLTPTVGPTGKITTAVKPATGSAQKPSKQAHFKQFTDPFVIIEEGDLYLAPIHKQYPMTQSGRVSFPVLRWEGSAPHCPFCYTMRPREDGKYWSDLLVDLLPPPAAPQPEVAATEQAQVVVTVHGKEDRKAVPKVPNKRASFGGDPAKRKDFSPKAKPGYCECCFEKYEALRPHILTTKHRDFASCAANYGAVDVLLARLARAPLIDSGYNPILAWSTAKAAAGHAAVHMSPAHSTILSQCTRRSVLSALHPANGPPLLEDKENDLPSGLELPGLDCSLLVVGEKRRNKVSSDSDVFQEADPTKRKFRRIGLKQP